jgi:hypothetical protein
LPEGLDWPHGVDPLNPWFDAFRGAVDDQASEVAAPTVVAFDSCPPEEAYEAFIARTGQVPTRDDNLHDALNRLVWQRHPALKRRMNALHAQQIASRGVGATRGPVRDALTLFDESGLWWPKAPQALAAALAKRDWQALFVTHRNAWQGQALHLIGHALLEQLETRPRKGLTAHVLLHDNPLSLSADAWAHKPFHPLPVLGIPGWCTHNEHPSYYEDTAVFRPPRA